MYPLTKHFLNKKNILFVCIGTDRSTGDSVGPLAGSFLKAKGFEVVGTLHNPVHSTNLKETMKHIKKEYPAHYIVAIDAALSKRVDDIGKVIVEEGPIVPGIAVGKSLPAVGDISIKGVVNIISVNNHSVLQNTRLSAVWDLATEIVQLCEDATKNNLSVKKPNVDALDEIAATKTK